MKKKSTPDSGKFEIKLNLVKILLNLRIVKWNNSETNFEISEISEILENLVGLDFFGKPKFKNVNSDIIQPIEFKHHRTPRQLNIGA
jgi:hypothetical protein